MTTSTVSTRRRFFWSAGAALSAPIAVASGYSLPSGRVNEALKARLTLLEDVDAIRELHRAYARLIDAGERGEAAQLFAVPATARLDETLRRMTGNRFGEQDVIDVATDRRTATARIHCVVETETPVGPDCTLVEMARAQGDGVVRRSEPRVLESACVRMGGAWKIDRLTWRRI